MRGVSRGSGAKGGGDFIFLLYSVEEEEAYHFYPKFPGTDLHNLGQIIIINSKQAP